MKWIITIYMEEGEMEQRAPLPNKSNGEIFAVVEQHMGGGRLRIICDEFKARFVWILFILSDEIADFLPL